MLRRSALALAITAMTAASLVTGALPAAAATTTGYFDGTIPLTPTDWNLSVTIPKFDPTLGRLTGVECRIVGAAEGDAQLENRSTSSATSQTVQLAVTETLSKPGGGTIVVAIPLINETVNLAVYDGVTDFAGASGKTLAPVANNVTNQNLLTAPADLALFTAGSIGETITLPIAAVGNSSITGGGNIIGGVTSEAGVTAGCRYTYEPVPTPVVPEFPMPVVASLAALAVGAGAIGWSRRNKLALG